MLAVIQHESITGLCPGAYTDEQIKAWSPQPLSGGPARKRLAGQTVWTAYDAEGPCAFMTMTDEGHIDYCFALPRAAGLGAAPAIYDALELFARGQGLSALTANVSLVAKSFFDKRGFDTLRESTPIRRGVALLNYQMKKVLT